MPSDVVVTGVIIVSTPEEACITFTIREIAGRQYLMLERDSVVAPVLLKPPEQGNVCTGILSLMPSSYEGPPEQPVFADGL